jgi:hypothetical protein
MRQIAMSMAFLAVAGTSAWAQDPPAPDEEDDGLTPAQAMELLNEAKELMGKAEELLGDSSRGKALETEKDLIEKLNKLDPALAQKAILEKIGKLVEKAEKRESDVIGKLDEIIRKAKS